MLLILSITTSLSSAAATPEPPCYSAVATVDPTPLLSFQGGTSDFAQVFNPSWVVGNAAGTVKPGLMVRTQNCTGCGLGPGDGPAAHKCCGCNMKSANDSLRKRSILTFSPLAGSDGAAVAKPRFERIGPSSVVFEPVDEPPLNDDFRGTEDPRIAFDPATQTYYMFYTCFARTKGGTLCLASSKTPTTAGSWTRHGSAFPGNHKSGALLIRESGPHYLISGAGQIHISQSDDLTNWTLGPLFIKQTSWGNPHVEAGPPPMKLQDGNYVFFLNSWGSGKVPLPGYQPAWVVLDGKDPTKILAEAPESLWSPDTYPWMAGYRPGQMCNVPQVAFLEAAHPVDDKPDTFRVYYGGSDAVLGTAIVEFTKNTGVKCM